MQCFFVFSHTRQTLHVHASCSSVRRHETLISFTFSNSFCTLYNINYSHTNIIILSSSAQQWSCIAQHGQNCFGCVMSSDGLFWLVFIVTTDQNIFHDYQATPSSVFRLICALLITTQYHNSFVINSLWRHFWFPWSRSARPLHTHSTVSQ